MTVNYIRISMDIPFMRNIDIKDGILSIEEDVEVVFEKRVTPFGNSAKIDAPKKYIGKRVYIIVVND
jgi:putative transposon-encoded protein